MSEATSRGLKALVMWGVAAVLLGCGIAPELPPPTAAPTEAPVPLPTETDICFERCQREGFSTGRCGCSSCNMEETSLESVRPLTNEEMGAIQEGCGPLPGGGSVPLPCLWVCCCQ